MATPKSTFIISAENRASAVLNRVGNDFGKLQGAVRSAAGLLATFGGALSVGVVAGWAREVAGLQDEIGKLAQSTGVGVQALSELDFAAKLSDVSTEELGNGLVRLTARMGDVAQGLKESRVGFDALGVKVQEADGTLRSADDVLRDVAQRFSEFEDGSTKTALAVELFGRSGAKLIPLLNSGRDGLASMGAEARALGVAFDEKASKSAEEFNDNLTRLGASWQGMKITFFGPLIESLASVTSGFIAAKNAGLGFIDALDAASGIDRQIEFYERQAADLQKKIDSSTKNSIFNLFGTQKAKEYQTELDKITSKLEVLRRVQLTQSGAFPAPSATATAPAPAFAPPTAKGSKAKAAGDELRSMIDGALQRDLERLQKDVDELDASIASALDRDADRLDAAAGKWKDIIDPTREYVRQLEEIRALVASGDLSPAEGIAAEFEVQNAMQDQVLGQIEETKAAITELDEFTLEAARNIQDALGQGVFDFLDGKFENIGKSFGNMLKKMAAEAIAADLGRFLLGDFAKSGKVGGAFGGILGAIFGGTRADGGPVAGGVPYLVGERGPELFVPKSSGTVMPNGSMGGVNITQNISVAAGASRGEVMTAMRVAKDSAKSEILESMRRGGVFA